MPTLRVNECTNPSFETNTTGWSATSETSDDLEAELLLRQAVLWLDAKYSSSSQTVPNQGTGGVLLDATLGSTSGADSNDPKWLPYEGTPYVYLPGVAGNYLSVPDSTALDITGDIDIRVKVALDDWTPASAQMLVAKEDEGSQRSYWLALQTDGTLVFHWSSTGAYLGTYAISTVVTGITDGSVKWVKVTRSSSSGDVKFYLSDDATTWTQLGTTVTSTPSAIFNSTTAVTVGAAAGGLMAAGKFYRAIVKNGIDGTTVLDVDTSVLTTGAATSFTATTGQTVTINRSTSGRKAVAVVGNCWLLGTDDYMEVADNALLDFDADDSFTVLAVVRQWDTPVSFGRYIHKRDTAGTNPGWAVGSNGTTVQPSVTLDDGPDGVVENGSALASGACSIYGMRVDRTAQRLYAITGATISAGGNISAVGDTSNSVAVRIGVFGTYQAFELIAVAVFRSALTSDQIAQLNTYFQARAALATAAPSRSTTSPQSGTHVGQFANTAGYPTRGAVYASAAVVAGTAYTGSLYARGGTASARAVIDWYSGSTYLSRSAGTAAALSSSLQRYSATGTAPVGATHARLRLDSAANTGTLTVDAALIEQAAELLPYFDGSVVASGLVYDAQAWAGTAHASTSSILAYSSVIEEFTAEVSLSGRGFNVTINAPDFETFTLSRSVGNDTVIRTVRGADGAALSGIGAAYLFDIEVPQNTEVRYLLTVERTSPAPTSVTSAWLVATGQIDRGGNAIFDLTRGSVPQVVKVNDWSQHSHDAPMEMVWVDGRADPVVISSTRRLPSSTMTLLTTDEESYTGIMEALAGGITCYTPRYPDEAGIPEGIVYLSTGRITVTKLNQRGQAPARLISVEVQEISPPPAEFILQAYRTWDEAYALGLTWDALAAAFTWDELAYG